MGFQLAAKNHDLPVRAFGTPLLAVQRGLPYFASNTSSPSPSGANSTQLDHRRDTPSPGTSPERRPVMPAEGTEGVDAARGRITMDATEASLMLTLLGVEGPLSSTDLGVLGRVDGVLSETKSALAAEMAAWMRESRYAKFFRAPAAASFTRGMTVEAVAMPTNGLMLPASAIAIRCSAVAAKLPKAPAASNWASESDADNIPTKG
mmetsp:Transcript_46503/g.118042  ORF Transcript_46503/g.118042 Transcript_46503/m.118042 type:complete len:206 (+) Transcript_46503:3-620(+)